MDASHASSLAATPRTSLMLLAVVERQLIMQGLDLASLARVSSTCQQLAVEALHPSCGRFLPALTRDLTPFSHPLQLSVVARVHVPMSARLDGLDSLGGQLVDSAVMLDSFLSKLATFRRITSLSLWGCPKDIDEEQALRLIDAVPLVETLWGVRMGSVFVQSHRVQEAIFSLPQLTRCGLDFTVPGGELQPSLLALAPKLRNLALKLHASDLSPLLVLGCLSHLHRVWLTFDATLSSDRPVLRPHLPTLEQFGFEVADGLGIKDPSIEQIEALMAVMPALKGLTLGRSRIGIAVLESLKQSGPSCFPCLECIELQASLDYRSNLTRELFSVFPGLELRVPTFSTAPEDSEGMDVRHVKRSGNEDDDYLSLRPLQPSPSEPVNSARR